MNKKFNEYNSFESLFDKYNEIPSFNSEKVYTESDQNTFSSK